MGTTNTVSPLRQRMIEDIPACKLTSPISATVPATNSS
jgi:hypothetical protein